MFEALSDKLTGVFDRLRGRGALSEADVTEALREVRLALLDADVALPVVRDFIAKVRERAVGSEVLSSVTPGQQVVKIVNDVMVEALGGEGAVPLNLNAPAPIPILMVGLQGSGKTTTSGKLALRLRERLRRRVLLASLDTQRPAAQLQLAQLAEQAEVPSLPIVAGQTPVQIAQRAMDVGRREGFDIVILDTAGRLSIDEALMDEVRQVRAATSPVETLLVVDAMTGQDAVNTAKAFNEAVGVTGIVMTRMDGDARGGAALSMRAITGAPIKLVGVGEKQDALEDFHPERVAGRILGQGDILGPGRARRRDDRSRGGRKARRQDDAGEVRPRGLRQPAQADRQDGQPVGHPWDAAGCGRRSRRSSRTPIWIPTILKRQAAIISSMTLKERRAPDIIKASRKKRIASGSGTSVQEVNRLLKQFDDMTTMMKRMNKLGQKGLMRNGLAALMPKGMVPNRTDGLILNSQETLIDGSEDPPCPRRREEAPLLPHRGGRQPQPARRALHREAGQLQSDAAGRTRGPRAAAGRAHPALGVAGRGGDRSGGEVPRQDRASAPMPALREQPVKSAPKKKAQERAKAAAGAAAAEADMCRKAAS